LALPGSNADCFLNKKCVMVKYEQQN
jgi:hypothetical protein